MTGTNPTRPLAVLLIGLCGAGECVQAQEANPQRLDQIVVTATRGEKSVDKIPGAVTVIDRKEIQQQTLIAADPAQLLAT